MYFCLYKNYKHLQNWVNYSPMDALSRLFSSPIRKWKSQNLELHRCRCPYYHVSQIKQRSGLHIRCGEISRSLSITYKDLCLKYARSVSFSRGCGVLGTVCGHVECEPYQCRVAPYSTGSGQAIARRYAFSSRDCATLHFGRHPDPGQTLHPKIKLGWLTSFNPL